MGFYEQQFGEQEKEKTRLQDAQPQQERTGLLRGNYYRLLIDNFKFILFFIPALVCFYIGLAAGIFQFLLAGLILLIPAGPAVAAMYDMGYQIARELAGHERRTFFESYRLNFKQGIATMAILVPFLVVLLLSLLVIPERPVWMTVCLLVGGYGLISFAIYAFSQIALVALPLRQIWRNALIMIFIFGWKGLLVAVMQLLALAVLYSFVSYAFAAFLFLGPALLIAWSAALLFPRLNQILVTGSASDD